LGEGFANKKEKGGGVSISLEGSRPIDPKGEACEGDQQTRKLEKGGRTVRSLEQRETSKTMNSKTADASIKA